MEVQAASRRRRVGHRPAADVRLDARHRDPGAVQPAYAQHRLHLRVAADACTCSTTDTSSGPSSTRRRSARHGYAAARVHGRQVAAAPAAVLLLRRPVPVLGHDRHVRSRRLPCTRLDAVPARHRPPRPRRAVAHPLRRENLADDRPLGHRDQLRARPRDRRARRLLRRLGRHDGAADHRGHPLVSRAAAVDGAVRRAPGDVEPDPDLLRHYGNPGDAGLDGPRPRRPLEAACAARGGLHDGRAADGCEAEPHHRSPPAARVHEPPDRLSHAVDSRA